MKKDQQQTQQHVHVMSEDEAAGLRKQLVRFHCISCDRPIDAQPHPFVSFVDFVFVQLTSFVYLFLIIFCLFVANLDSKRVFPQIRACVPSSHPDHTQHTNWTKYANFKRGLPLIEFRAKTLIILFFSNQLILVSSLAMSLAAVWRMSMQLFDNVAVHTQ